MVKLWKRKLFKLAGRGTVKAILAVLGILFAIIGVFELTFWDRVYPGVYVEGAHLGGKNKKEASMIIQSQIDNSGFEELTVISGNKNFVLSKEKMSLRHDSDATADKALSVGRKGMNFISLKETWIALKSGINIPYTWYADEAAITRFIEAVEQESNMPGIPPKIEVQSGKIIIDPGESGKSVDREKLRQDIYQAIALVGPKSIVAAENSIETPTQEQISLLHKRAEKFLGAKLTLTQDDTTIIWKENDLVTLLEARGGFNDLEINKAVEKVATQIDRPVQDASFRFENGRVLEFKPAKDGITTNKEESKSLVTDYLSSIERGETKEIALGIPITRSSPAIKNDNVNNLGLKERIGFGTSRFRGSSPSRVHNIGLAASRINGTLIPPGQTFSFNGAVGDVSNLTGYQQAYVIEKGKIVLGDGGGVCQVSTTFFRTTLNAGLPIIERRAHSYRVSYYEQDSSPGIDATIFSPSPDLKIKNDTPAHILIQTDFNPKAMTLKIELYGTNDGRAAAVSKPRITDVVPASDEDLYQDDPTLPAGVTKQVNPKVSGAKVVFDYKVTRGNEVLQDKKFTSNYRPWQALHLRGTGGVVTQ